MLQWCVLSIIRLYFIRIISVSVAQRKIEIFQVEAEPSLADLLVDMLELMAEQPVRDLISGHRKANVSANDNTTQRRQLLHPADITMKYELPVNGCGDSSPHE